MNLFGLVLILASFMVIAAAGAILFFRIRSRASVQKSLNMALFLIKVPREVVKQESRQNEKELISVGEQLLSSFANIRTKGWNRLLFGDPYLAFEIAVHRVGEETHFYMAVPASHADIIEKQIHSYYPMAEVSHSLDYNVFNPDGASAGGYLSQAKDHILPIRTYLHLESDPIGALLTALSKLQTQGEGAAIQLLLRPSHSDKASKHALKVAREMQSGHTFKEAVGRVKHPPKKKEDGKNEEFKQPRVVSPADEELIKAIGTKASKQAFEVNVRFLASAENELMADQIIKELEGAIVQYAAPEMNSFKLNKLTGRAFDKLAYKFSFRIFDERRKMHLSTEEVNSLYHFPTGYTAAPKVSFLKAKPAEPPADLPKEGILLGTNNFRGQETQVYLDTTDRRRHLYIIGQTGTGKTTFMKNMIEQDMARGHGLCIIEPHGEFAEYALSIVPKERAHDVIYFNPADLEMPMGLNFLEFDPTHPEQKTLKINELLNVVDKLYNLKDTGGPMFEKYFRNACMLLMDDFQYHFENTGEIDETKIPVVADISRIMVDANFRNAKLERERDPLVTQFWKQEAEKAGGDWSLANMAPYISTKIDVFVTNVFLKNILNQRRSSINFRQVMDEGKILIVRLSKGTIGEINAHLLGMLIVSELTIAALSRTDAQEDQFRDFYMYIDEFQNFTTDNIATILAEARKYKLNMTLAHQYIKQLPEKIRDAVFGNVGSKVVFRVGPDDAEYLKNEFDPIFNVQDLANIDNFNAYVKLLINNKTTKPFNVQTIKERAGDRTMADQIAQISRLTYGMPRAEVEELITSSYEEENSEDKINYESSNF